MELDGPPAQEQLSGHVSVGMPAADQGGDLLLLRVSCTKVEGSRFRAVSPEARSSWRARSAHGLGAGYPWIDLPGVIRDGTVIHRRGATEAPGLYFLGLTWQHTRGSALLGFVHDDAAYLADLLTTTALTTEAAARPAAQQPA